MTTYTTSYAGNAALQEERWIIPLAVCERIQKQNKFKSGSYWFQNFTKAFRAQKRRGLTEIKIYTAGFSTAEFASLLTGVGEDYAKQ